MSATPPLPPPPGALKPAEDRDPHRGAGVGTGHKAGILRVFLVQGRLTSPSTPIPRTGWEGGGGGSTQQKAPAGRKRLTWGGGFLVGNLVSRVEGILSV